MSEELTPWFPPETKPHRAGVYQTRTPNTDSFDIFQHWNGKSWGCCCYTPHKAYSRREYASFYQNNEWRGIYRA